jgi:hypothetical protein
VILYSDTKNLSRKLKRITFRHRISSQKNQEQNQKLELCQTEPKNTEATYQIENASHCIFSHISLAKPQGNKNKCLLPQTRLKKINITLLGGFSSCHLPKFVCTTHVWPKWRISLCQLGHPSLALLLWLDSLHLTTFHCQRRPPI